MCISGKNLCKSVTIRQLSLTSNQLSLLSLNIINSLCKALFTNANDTILENEDKSYTGYPKKLVSTDSSTNNLKLYKACQQDYIFHQIKC